VARVTPRSRPGAAADYGKPQRFPVFLYLFQMLVVSGKNVRRASDTLLLFALPCPSV